MRIKDSRCSTAAAYSICDLGMEEKRHSATPSAEWDFICLCWPMYASFSCFTDPSILKHCHLKEREYLSLYTAILFVVSANGNQFYLIAHLF